jgi:hypothetical protein
MAAEVPALMKVNFGDLGDTTYVHKWNLVAWGIRIAIANPGILVQIKKNCSLHFSVQKE